MEPMPSGKGFTTDGTENREHGEWRRPSVCSVVFPARELLGTGVGKIERRTPCQAGDRQPGIRAVSQACIGTVDSQGGSNMKTRNLKLLHFA